jgi:tetratricopeptide (TPR) repeat protein
MSELKNLLRETKYSLRDLETLLQKARSMDCDQDQPYILSREELQKYFEEIRKVLESLPENLKIEKGLEEKRETKNLRPQMEEVRRKVEECFGRVEEACEANLRELSRFIENLCSGKTSQIEEGEAPTKMPVLSELLSQGKSHFENQEFDACLEMMNKALNVDPGNREATGILIEAQKKLEDRRLEEELVVHIENLKKEAMDQFDEEQYRDCMRTFQFLCELEPKNRTLRDYLALSRQKAEEMEATQPKSGSSRSSEAVPETNLNASIFASKPSAQSEISPELNIAREYPKASPDPESKVRDLDEVPESTGPVNSSANQAHPLQEDLSQPIDEPPSVADEEQSSLTRTLRSPKRLIALLAVVALLFAAVFGSRTSVKPAKPKDPVVSGFEIQSDPEAARVFIDGEFKGQTRLQLESLSEGNHQLRVEMEGYAPLTQVFSQAKIQPTVLSVRLSKVVPPPQQDDDLQDAARTLFAHGNFLEANRTCDAVLQKDARNILALEIKEKIKTYYLRQGKNAISKGRWEEARVALENTLKVAPDDGQVSGQLRLVQTKLKKSPVAINTGESQMASRIQDLHQQISTAISVANYLPPNTGNAFDLLRHLGSIAPTDSFAKEKLDQIHHELLNQIQRRMQAKDFDAAKSLAQQVQTHFPDSSELRVLRDGLRAEEAKLMETWSSLIQKAESTAAAGRYVAPQNDNALLYANRLLAIDSQNQRALALKKESVAKAAAQARELIQTEKFEEAREVYSALLQLSSSESRPQAPGTDLKREIEKLEFNAYPVVHDHTLMGSCTGRLRANAYVISFIPSGNSKDGFSAKLAEVEVESPGDKLKIMVRNKTYRYEANLVKSREENREKLEQIYQRLIELKTKVN